MKKLLLSVAVLVVATLVMSLEVKDGDNSVTQEDIAKAETGLQFES